MGEHHLAGILYADVADYSRLMGSDEDGTLARLKALRRELLDPRIASRRGRIVSTSGDGILVEFSSIVEAVTCAVEVQADAAGRNARIPEGQRLELRIGVHVGDVIAEPDGDLFGDGVNTAARLQAIAEPGAVLVSRPVRDQVRDKLAFGFEDFGERKLKNIARPIHVYRVLFDPAAVPLAAATRAGRAKLARRQPLVQMAAGIAALLTIAGAVIWWQPWETYSRTALPERMAFPLPEKPSVAVLPFANLGSDAEQGAMAEGLTESIINALARTPFLFVIAHTSTANYRGPSAAPRRAAEELGVRYIVEGSVKRAAERVRVTTQLVDTAKGRVMWSERYEREIGDLLALEDDITTQIARSLDVRITFGTEQTAGGTRKLDAWTAYVKGRSEHLKFTTAGNARAREHYQRALQLDPNYGEAVAALAQTYLVDMVNPVEDPQQVLSRIMALERQAAQIDPRMPRLFELRSLVAMAQGDNQRALAEAEAMVDLDPNGAESHFVLGRLYFYNGQYERAIASLKTAERINPHSRPSYLSFLGLSNLALHRTDAALSIFEAITRRWPDYAPVHLYLAAAYQLAGREKEARQQAALWRNTSESATMRTVENQFAVAQDRQFAERIIKAAQQAGVPE